MSNHIYKKQVELLLKILPSLMKCEDFALHGGTAINLFHKDLPRYSVDVDLTYIPILEREESLRNINHLLNSLKSDIEKKIPSIKRTHSPDTCKLLCNFQGVPVKIEVNKTKRGLIEPCEMKALSNKVQDEFNSFALVRVVSTSQLYGGKLSAGLSRQHPRDLFDYKYMDIPISEIKEGLIYSIIGGDKPILEYLSPNFIDQRKALENQFLGMTNLSFSYEDYEKAREDMIDKVNNSLSSADKEFLISFEEGNPDWKLSNISNLSNFPSVMWKLQNIQKLKEGNPLKHKENVSLLREHLCYTQIKNKVTTKENISQKSNPYIPQTKKNGIKR